MHLFPTLENQHIPTNHISLILKMTVGVPQVPTSLEDERFKKHDSKTQPSLAAHACHNVSVLRSLSFFFTVVQSRELAFSWSHPLSITDRVMPGSDCFFSPPVMLQSKEQLLTSVGKRRLKRGEGVASCLTRSLTSTFQAIKVISLS